MTQADILIVEDEPIVAVDLKRELEFMGHNVCGIATSGMEAFRIVEKELPDLVLMDITLKGNLDGTQVAKEMRNRYNLPVVYVTGYANEQMLTKAKETDPVGYIVKPYDERELYAVVELALTHPSGIKTKRSERWFASIIRNLSDAIIATDIGGFVRFINPGAESLLGMNAKEVIGLPINKLLEFKTEKDPITTADDFMKEGGLGIVHKGNLQLPENKTKQVDYIIDRIINEEGKFEGFVLSIRNPDLKSKEESV